MRTLLFAIGLVILVAGCNRKKAEVNPPEPAANQPSEPSQEGLGSLCGDSNPYISNIAKHAMEFWKVKDYRSAVIEMKKLIGLSRTTTQRNAATSSMGQLKLEINRAAAKGDANAQDAAAQLGD
jgi:hypothetical protein